MTKDDVSIVRWYTGVFVCCTALYVLTCAPGLLWQDSGLIQYRVWNNDIRGFFGLATAHPLYYLVAIPLKYLTTGWFPFSINLISALAGAVTVANVFLMVRLWTGAPLPGLVAAVSLALSHTFWRHACIAETYTLWSALFTLELILFYLYLHKDKTGALMGLALVNGLAVSVHLLASISLFVYLAILLSHCIRRRLRLSTLVKATGLWILGALPLLILLFQQAQATGNIPETLQSMVYGKHWQQSVLNTSVTLNLVIENLLYIGLNFPSPILIVAVLGWIMTLCAKPLRSVTGLGILYFVFAFRYTVPDRYAFFIPFYILTALAVGWGSHRLFSRYREAGLRVALVLAGLMPALVYAVLPRALEMSHVQLPTRGDVPYRHDVSYFLTPWKQREGGARQFAIEALSEVGPEGILFADLTTAPPLLILQAQEGYRADVHVISAAVSSPQAPLFSQESLPDLMRVGPVYVVSSQPGYCPAFVLERYRLVRSGVLWRVLPRREGTG
jgi:hypothetical protein